MKSFSKTRTVSGAIFISLLMMSGCATDIGSKSYSEDDIGEVAQTEQAVVVKIREVKVAPDKLSKNKTGAIAGGLGGGLVGSQLASGFAGTVATVGMAGAGAVGGAFAEKALSTQTALEITVRLSTGSLQTLVQGNDVNFKRGEHILILHYARGRSKVVKEVETADEASVSAS